MFKVILWERQIRHYYCIMHRYFLNIYIGPLNRKYEIVHHQTLNLWGGGN